MLLSDQHLLSDKDERLLLPALIIIVQSLSVFVFVLVSVFIFVFVFVFCISMMRGNGDHSTLIIMTIKLRGLFQPKFNWNKRIFANFTHWRE